MHVCIGLCAVCVHMCAVCVCEHLVSTCMNLSLRAVSLTSVSPIDWLFSRPVPSSLSPGCHIPSLFLETLTPLDGRVAQSLLSGDERVGGGRREGRGVSPSPGRGSGRSLSPEEALGVFHGDTSSFPRP